MDVKTVALADTVAECFNDIEVKEPSVTTMLMNFDSSFDPYGSMSTPLYQSATIMDGGSMKCMMISQIDYFVFVVFSMLLRRAWLASSAARATATVRIILLAGAGGGCSVEATTMRQGTEKEI
ncbi:unnamed protein product [Amaranthus hypochondriacus]